jgi:hypothetical protein
MGKEDAFASDPIERRGLHHGITHRPGMKPRLVVGNTKKDVGAGICPANEWNKAPNAQCS